MASQPPESVPRGGEERFRGKAGGGSGDPGPWGGCRSPHADVDAVDAVSPGKGADRPATSSEVERYWSAIARVQRWDCNCLTARRMMDVTKVVFARRAREAFDRKSRGREKLYADLANGTLKQGRCLSPLKERETGRPRSLTRERGRQHLCERKRVRRRRRRIAVEGRRRRCPPRLEMARILGTLVTGLVGRKRRRRMTMRRRMRRRRRRRRRRWRRRRRRRRRMSRVKRRLHVRGGERERGKDRIG
ncbi:unnamed protein product [Closterium sp. NIES-53]